MHTLNLFSEFLKSKWRALKKHSLKLVDYMKLAAYTCSMNKIKMPRLYNDVGMKCATKCFIFMLRPKV